jgi:hypothetical protein
MTAASACMEPVNRAGSHSFVFLNVTAGHGIVPTPTFFCTAANSCLNDGKNGGAGSVVRLYAANSCTEEFGEPGLPGRCAGGHVTGSCPFTNTQLTRPTPRHRRRTQVRRVEPLCSKQCPVERHCASRDGHGHQRLNRFCRAFRHPVHRPRRCNDQRLLDQPEPARQQPACMEPVNGTGGNSLVYLDPPAGMDAPRGLSADEPTHHTRRCHEGSASLFGAAAQGSGVLATV